MNPKLLESKLWRMNNLYVLVDKDGRTVRFHLNQIQSELFNNLHALNVILKARQEGCTSFSLLYFLDECLFHDNVEAGVIAHTRDDATDIFRRKVVFPYEHLPPEIQTMRPRCLDSQTRMSFNNGSTLTVSTSLRGSTLQYLLVSELGRIAIKNPEQAREIMTGAAEAVSKGNSVVIVESTAKGKGGAFFDLCDTARKIQTAGKPLTSMDYRWHFFAWFDGEDNATAEPAQITAKMAEYFAGIEKWWALHGRIVQLTMPQKAWYIKKRSVLGDDILSEHPGTPDEAFEWTNKGAIFGEQMDIARSQGRICKVPHTSGVTVDVWSDIGVGHRTSLWFTQDVGRQTHVIRFYESNNSGLEHYRDVMDKLAKEDGYHYGRIVFPHDISVKEWGSGLTRIEMARNLGINAEMCPRCLSKGDSIQVARTILSTCVFDEEHCELGVKHLDGYRWAWDDINGQYKPEVMTTVHNDGADAFQTFAQAHEWRTPGSATQPVRCKARRIITVSARGWT